VVQSTRNERETGLIFYQERNTERAVILVEGDAMTILTVLRLIQRGYFTTRTGGPTAKEKTEEDLLL